jgi:hypothetical protein
MYIWTSKRSMTAKLKIMLCTSPLTPPIHGKGVLSEWRKREHETCSIIYTKHKLWNLCIAPPRPFHLGISLVGWDASSTMGPCLWLVLYGWGLPHGGRFAKIERPLTRVSSTFAPFFPLTKTIVNKYFDVWVP